MSGSAPAVPSATGDLQKTPFAHLLLYALEKALTGTLVLGDGAGSITLEGGLATKVRTREPVAFLGRILVETGALADDVYNRTLLEVSKTKRLHGQILLEARAITEGQLREGLRVQILRKLAHFFTLPPSTTFAFHAAQDLLASWGGDPYRSDAGRGVDPLPVVWRGLCEAPPWELVHGTLARLQRAKFRVPSAEAAARFEFAGDVRAAAELLTSKALRANELAQAGVLSPKLTQLLLYCLTITKQVEVTDSGGASTAPPPPGARSLAPTPAAPVRGKVASQPEVAAVSVAELQVRRTEILDRAGSIDKQDYFQMLGVTPDATSEEIQAAFFTLAKRWHPDRLPQALADVREACARVFSRLGEAHQTLADGERRGKYMRLLKEGGATPEEQATVAAVLDAAATFQRAEIAMKRGDMAQAETLARKAHEADGLQADYLAMLAWLEAQRPENQSPEATHARISMLDRAVQLGERCERAYFYRGMLHKRLNNAAFAARDFKKTAELNPRNIDALREVRLFNMRKSGNSTPPPARSSAPPGPLSDRPPPESAKPGLLGRFFKK